MHLSAVWIGQLCQTSIGLRAVQRTVVQRKEMHLKYLCLTPVTLYRFECDLDTNAPGEALCEEVNVTLKQETEAGHSPFVELLLLVNPLGCALF